MKSEIRAYYNEYAYDSKDYEFVDLKVIDTLTVGNRAEKEIGLIEDNIKLKQELLNEYKIQFVESMSAVVQYGKDFQFFVDEAKEGIKVTEEKITSYKNEIAEYEKDLNSKEVLGYVVEHHFKIKNEFGQLGTTKLYFLFNKQLKILGFSGKKELDTFKLTSN
jgi:hypothetical protein